MDLALQKMQLGDDLIMPTNIYSKEGQSKLANTL